MKNLAKLTQPVLPAPIIRSIKPLKILDFSAGNELLKNVNLSDLAGFEQFVFDDLLENSRYIGIGGYGEDRVIYHQREHFQDNQSEARSIHLGVDIWTDAGTPLFSPVDGIVHSYANNDGYGDYGPTVILKHDINGIMFYTLYGHLAIESLRTMYVGKRIARGDRMGSIGRTTENGNWPPHVHFQLITDIGPYNGDFPGVCTKKERNYFLKCCPDPSFLIRIID